QTVMGGAAPPGEVEISPFEGPVPMTEERGASLGCASWIVGAGVILVLAGLVWFGSHLSDRLSGFGADDDPTATATTATLAETEDPTATVETHVEPTPTAAIVASVPTETAEPTTEAVAVPSLIGLSVDDATAELDPLGLVLEVGDNETSEDVPEGN